jgi:hypothetical protein
MKIGLDIENVEMVTTDDGSRIPAQYPQFVEIISKVKAETLLSQRPTYHANALEPSYKQPYWRIDNHSESELTTLKVCI